MFHNNFNLIDKAMKSYEIFAVLVASQCVAAVNLNSATQDDDEWESGVAYQAFDDVLKGAISYDDQ